MVDPLIRICTLKNKACALAQQKAHAFITRDSIVQHSRMYGNSAYNPFSEIAHTIRVLNEGNGALECHSYGASVLPLLPPDYVASRKHISVAFQQIAPGILLGAIYPSLCVSSASLA